MNDFTEEELFELYKNAFEDAEDRGLDYDGCKQVAYDAIVEYGGAPSFTLSGRIGRWLQIRNYKEAHKPIELMQNNKPQSYWDTLNWKDCWRTACKSGFVPYREYIEAFLPESKTIQWSAYKNFMQSEGWVFEPIEFGWNTTFVEPEPESIPDSPMFFVTRELIEQITIEIVNRLKQQL